MSERKRYDGYRGKEHSPDSTPPNMGTAAQYPGGVSGRVTPDDIHTDIQMTLLDRALTGYNTPMSLMTEILQIAIDHIYEKQSRKAQATLAGIRQRRADENRPDDNYQLGYQDGVSGLARAIGLTLTDDEPGGCYDPHGLEESND